MELGHLDSTSSDPYQQHILDLFHPLALPKVETILLEIIIQELIWSGHLYMFKNIYLFGLKLF